MGSLTVLPSEIQEKWRAGLHKPEDFPGGVYRLTDIRTHKKNINLIVYVIDEYGMAMAGHEVVFSYDTADYFLVDPVSVWTPPQPWRGDVVQTDGAGEAEHTGSRGSVVKEGQPGGITVYVKNPKYASDYVTGAGMLSDHTSLHMTFQLQRPGVKSLEQRVEDLEIEVKALRAVVTGMP